MDSYTKYLVDNVLSEDKTVTYRLLSRALKVHANTAKQMLYEFHLSQNAKRPGTVHATYLVYGVKKGGNIPKGANEDVEMASSPPYAESVTEVVQSYALSLITEESLKDALAGYEEVSSIHVYSVAPHATKDMGLLADVANEVLSLSTAKDEISVPITNPYVRTRERRGAGLKAAAAPSVPAAKQQAKAPASKAASAASPAEIKEESKAEPGQAIAKAENITKKSTPALKRGGSSGIMAAFSKAAAKPKKDVKTKAEKPSAEDTTMALSDDGEDDEEVEMLKSKPRSTAGTKTKKEREEELRRMMDDDDDDQEQKEEEEEEEEEEEQVKSEKAESPEPEPMEEEPTTGSVEEEKSEVVESSNNGRRRGKRKVMRKKQIMDEQGYLVTIQEPGWESFSEDEAPPPRPATKPKIAVPAPVASKGKKGAAAKGGQGSIMSFFSKKA